MTWFTLVNVGGAVLAAVPVALGVAAVTTPRRRVKLGLLIGVLPALYIFVGGLIEFGIPPSTAGWIIDIAQFFAVSLAVTAVLMVVRGRPLTIAGAAREAR